MADRPQSTVPVLQLVDRFWIGGSERQFIERLRRHPAGFSPVVACLEMSGAMFDQVRELGHMPLVFPLGGSLLRANTAVQVARIARVIRQRGIKIVHSTDFKTNLLGLAAARLAGVRSIVSRVDLGHPREGFGKWHREAEKLSARRADLVVANAEAVRRVCIEEEGCDPSRVVVVMNGIDLPRFDAAVAAGLKTPLPVPEGAPVVAIVGNLWPVKGHRTLVEALGMLKGELPGWRFVCAGDGPERSWIERRIQELGLADRLFLLGHRFDIPALLARSRAAALCSSAEGLSNALMEAMAARLPIVATRVGGNPELVREGENGFLVPYGDAAALAARFRELLSGPAERRAEMGNRGRAHIEAELTLEHLAKGHAALYRKALGTAASMDTAPAVAAAMPAHSPRPTAQ
ncbi:MAG TPA: glycosyltransferase [Myxococcales bacterium]|jgi:L-malate glycosyltransferase|nr:glycosyltransferase [Myxococcales bacterium]